MRRIAEILVLALLPVALWAESGGPQWWSTRGIQNTNPANDYAATNQGQLKNIATAAVAELNENLTQLGGAGTALDQLAVTLSSTTANTNDYAAVNIGQLKAVAKPFFDRLLEVQYNGHPLESGTYPWAGKEASANDYAMANIGQVKNLFSFNLAFDSDNNSLPDWWERYYFGAIGQNPNALAPSGVYVNGTTATLLEAYQNQQNPVDFYNNSAPTLAITNGNSQTGSPGAFLSAPLVVKVTDTAGTAMAKAPLTFSVTQGGGTLQATSTGTNAASLTLRTNSSGYAIVYFQLPNSTNTQCQITCMPATGTYTQSVAFSENSDDGSGSYSAPTLPSDSQSENPVTPPVVSYLAIDVSNGVISGTTKFIALSDSNTMAFAYSDGNNLEVYTWENGTAAHNQTISPVNITMKNCEDWPEYGDQGDYNFTYYPYSISLTPSGKVYGALLNGGWNEVGFSSVNGEITLIGERAPYFSGLSFDFMYWQRLAEYRLVIASENAFIAQAMPYAFPVDGVSLDAYHCYYELYCNGSSTFFATASPDGTIPSNMQVVPSLGEPLAINDNGWVCWYGWDDENSDYGYSVWNGSTFVNLNGIPVAINNQNYIIGNNNEGGWIWVNNTTTPLLSLIPEEYQGQLSGITPRLLSNADGDGMIHIVCDATYTDPIDGSTARRTYTMGLPMDAIAAPANQSMTSRLAAQAASTSGSSGLFTLTVQEIHLPDGVSPQEITQVNANLAFVTVANNCSLILLPIELLDLNGSALDSGSNVVIEPKKATTDTNPKSIAWIDPHRNNDGPDMPQLVLRIKGADQMGLKIRWKLKVKYNRPNGSVLSEDTVQMPSSLVLPDGTVTSSSPDGWITESASSPAYLYAPSNPMSDWSYALSNGFFGGDAELTYQILKSDNSVLCGEQKILFNIEGKNPDDGKCKTYVNQQAQSTDNRLLGLSYAVARHESKDYNGEGSRYNQFWESAGTRFNATHKKGDPLWCKKLSEQSAGGFGIFQITGDATHGKYYNVSRNVMWNWQANLSAYLGIVKNEGNASKAYWWESVFLPWVQQHEGSSYRAPETSYTYKNRTMTAWEMAVITLYNGAGGCPKQEYNNGESWKQCPWHFDNPGWSYHENSNTYLSEVMKQIQ